MRESSTSMRAVGGYPTAEQRVVALCASNHSAGPLAAPEHQAWLTERGRAANRHRCAPRQNPPMPLQVIPGCECRRHRVFHQRHGCKKREHVANRCALRWRKRGDPPIELRVVLWIFPSRQLAGELGRHFIPLPSRVQQVPQVAGQRGAPQRIARIDRQGRMPHDQFRGGALAMSCPRKRRDRRSHRTRARARSAPRASRGRS